MQHHDQQDRDAIAQWLQHNKPTIIPMNQGGEVVRKIFYARRKVTLKKDLPQNDVITQALEAGNHDLQDLD